jgi:hypothetical protein
MAGKEKRKTESCKTSSYQSYIFNPELIHPLPSVNLLVWSAIKPVKISRTKGKKSL